MSRWLQGGVTGRCLISSFRQSVVGFCQEIGSLRTELYGRSKTIALLMWTNPNKQTNETKLWRVVDGIGGRIVRLLADRVIRKIIFGHLRLSNVTKTHVRIGPILFTSLLTGSGPLWFDFGGHLIIGTARGCVIRGALRPRLAAKGVQCFAGQPC